MLIAPEDTVFMGLPITTLMDYDGDGNLIYQGMALAHQFKPATVTVSAVTAASPAAFTATAHGLSSGNQVVISGATGDWAGINGTHIITVTGVDGFTVAVDASGFKGDFDGVVQTYAPQTCASVWQVKKYTYSSGKVVSEQTAYGSHAANRAWSDRTTLPYA